MRAGGEINNKEIFKCTSRPPPPQHTRHFHRFISLIFRYNYLQLLYSGGYGNHYHLQLLCREIIEVLLFRGFPSVKGTRDEVKFLISRKSC